MAYDPSQYVINGVAGVPEGLPMLSPYTSMAAPSRKLPAQAAYDQSINMSSLMPNQPAPQMTSLPLPQAPQMQQPQQATPQNGIMGEIMSQLVDTMKQKQDQGGLIQQILSQRMQPTMQDVGQSGLQGLNGLINGDISKVPTPEGAMADRIKSQLTPYADAATIAKTQQEQKFAPYTAYASLLNAQTNASGGATGAFVRQLAADPRFGGNLVDATQYAKGGANQGSMMRNGVMAPIEGALSTTQSDSQAKASGHELGTEGAKAQMTLPSIIANVQQQLKLIEDIQSDPNLKYYTGMGSVIPIIPGTPLADIDAKAKQVLGKSFMTAYETLKGGGSITEIEGQKATDAIARMQRAQTTSAYIAALNDYKDVIRTGIQRSQQKASMANPGMSPTVPGGVTHTYNPQTGQVEAVQ